MELTRRRSGSDQIHTCCAWVTILTPALSSSVVRHRQDFLSSWFPCLVLGYVVFDGFVFNSPLCLGFLRDLLSMISEGTL